MSLKRIWKKKILGSTKWEEGDLYLVLFIAKVYNLVKLKKKIHQIRKGHDNGTWTQLQVEESKTTAFPHVTKIKLYLLVWNRKTPCWKTNSAVLLF